MSLWLNKMFYGNQRRLDLFCDKFDIRMEQKLMDLFHSQVKTSQTSNTLSV